MDRSEIEKLFPALIENTNDVITIISIGGDLLYINYTDYGNKKLLYSADDLMGASWKKYIKPIAGGVSLDEIFESVARGNEWYGEIPMANADGSELLIQSRFFPIRNEKRETTHIGGMHRDITTIKKQMKFSDFRVKTEKTISRISKRFIPPFDLNAAIDESLEDIGSLFQVDRAYIFRIDNDSFTASNTNEWVAEGIEPQKDNLQDFDMRMVPWWNEYIKEGRTVNIYDVSTLPEEATAEREMLEAQGIKSIIVVHSRPGSALAGFMGLDSVKRKRYWAAEDETMLKTAWEIISRGIEHDRGETERRLLIDHLIETKKYEAVGRLAAGVAHDFNNLMAVIMGSVSLLRNIDLAGDKVASRCLDDIMEASVCANSLTSSLLSFSRQDSLQMFDVDIAALVTETCRLARSNLSETIRIEETFEESLEQIFCDRNRIFQTIVAILLNAGDALPDGGLIRINVSHTKYKKSRSSPHFKISKGDYLKISISDNGIGMDRDVAEKIFDPFFTTKDPDRGIGLGLSHAYGVVSDHKGAIFIETAPGRGSTFDVLLPFATGC